jgi:hypothetical protein
VIGANGSLTGFGGGLDRKRWLLMHEARAHALENSNLQGQLRLNVASAAPLSKH